MEPLRTHDVSAVADLPGAEPHPSAPGSSKPEAAPLVDGFPPGGCAWTVGGDSHSDGGLSTDGSDDGGDDDDDTDSCDGTSPEIAAGSLVENAASSSGSPSPSSRPLRMDQDESEARLGGDGSEGEGEHVAVQACNDRWMLEQKAAFVAKGSSEVMAVCLDLLHNRGRFAREMLERELGGLSVFSLHSVGGEGYRVVMMNSATVGELKAEVEARTGIPAVAQRLLLGPRELEDRELLLEEVLTPTGPEHLTLVRSLHTEQAAPLREQAADEDQHEEEARRRFRREAAAQAAEARRDRQVAAPPARPAAPSCGLGVFIGVALLPFAATSCLACFGVVAGMVAALRVLRR